MKPDDNFARQIEIGRQRLRLEEQIAKAEATAATERHRRGRILIVERFQDACRIVATRRLKVTIDHIATEMRKSIVNLSLKHVAKLAKDADLMVEWDGEIVRTKNFEDFIR